MKRNFKVDSNAPKDKTRYYDRMNDLVKQRKSGGNNFNRANSRQKNSSVSRERPKDRDDYQLQIHSNVVNIKLGGNLRQLANAEEYFNMNRRPTEPLIAPTAAANPPNAIIQQFDNKETKV